MSKISSLQNQLNQRNAEIGNLRKEIRDLKEQKEDPGLYMQVDYLQQKNDELSAANASLSSVNARLTEDAQRHFEARKAAEARADGFSAEATYWKAWHDELLHEVKDYQSRLKQAVSVETELMSTRVLMESYQKELLELKAQWAAERNLGRDNSKPSAVISKRFKYLEF